MTHAFQSASIEIHWPTTTTQLGKQSWIHICTGKRQLKPSVIFLLARCVFRTIQCGHRCHFPMGWKCCVPACRSGYAKSSESVSFHSFPKSVGMREVWLKAIHRSDFVIASYSRVCSRHFVKSDFKTVSADCNPTRLKSTEPLKLNLLKPGSVPSIFCGQPFYLTKNKVEPRKTKSATASQRFEKGANRIQQMKDQFFAADGSKR